MARLLGIVSKIFVSLALLACVAGLQVAYDSARSVPAGSGATAGAPGGGGLSPGMIRLIDMGFHPAVASFLWAATMPEVLGVFHGDESYFPDFAYMNAIDPKFGYPYAFSVLTLPMVSASVLPDAAARAQAIGLQGIASGDPDWRIPYYMALNYYLAQHDLKDATWYFNVAANTPGIPSYAKRFSLNFGINQKERDRVRALWATIYESSNDPATKDRAAAYVMRLNDFDYLEAAAATYKQKYGGYPSSIDVLVTKGIIPAVPQDPLGFIFTINPNDGSAGIDLTNLPAYVSQAPAK